MRCSCSRMRAESVSAVSSSSTGTTAAPGWGRSPDSHRRSAPCSRVTLTPCSMAWCCASRPGKRWQQRRVDVQNPHRELPHEVGAQQPHEARQADQIHLVLLQFRDHHAVVDFAVESLRWQSKPPSIPRRRAVSRPCASGRFEITTAMPASICGRGDVSRDGLEIRAAPGEQNADAFLHL